MVILSAGMEGYRHLGTATFYILIFVASWGIIRSFLNNLKNIEKNPESG
jgi:hypothetical protein